MSLLDAHGNPIASSSFSSGGTRNFAKGSPPILGEAFAPRWAGDLDKYIFQMPGGGVVLFDLSKLQLNDFRTMRDHYQVNACLAVMTFMFHQMDWKIECENDKIKSMVEENVEKIWTPLVRALSQSFWAGYSPSILQWENVGKYIELTKIKDQIPEECWVNWKTVDGFAPPGFLPPKVRVFDGIRTWGSQWAVPTENSLWYPLLMENGDYFGRKLLRPVFTSWYFSILIHLFSNRYFERFGEPVPVGRASYEDEITVPVPGGGAKKVLGADLMVQVLQNLRNRSVVVLPNDRTLVGTRGGGNAVEYDYSIEYLESQMRGADFERYLMRLDEEISLGLFTPLLILRTADVGSYNLGSTHWTMYMNMLNALVGDMKYYIDNFILSRLVDYNFGKSAPRAQITFRKMGDDRKDVVMALLQGLISAGTTKPDLTELGDIAGLTFNEVQLVTTGAPAPADPNAKPAGKATSKTAATTKSATKSGTPNKSPVSAVGTGKAGKSGQVGKTGTNKTSASGSGSSSSSGTKKSANSQQVISDIAARTANQVNKFIKDAVTDAVFEPSFGYEHQFASALSKDEAFDEGRIVAEVLRFGKLWIKDVPLDVFKSMDVDGMRKMIEETLSSKTGDLLDAGW